MAFALKGAGSATTDWSITANQSTFVLTTSTTAGAANDLAVLMYAVDNNATVDGDEGAVTGVTDSAGNFWQKAVEFTNGQGTLQTGATNGIWYCNLQNALAVGATITLAFSNNTSRDAAAVSLTYFTKAAGFKAAIEGTPGTLANDAANAGSLDVTTANIACLRIRSIASETSVATAITKTAAFTAVLTQSISTGGAATGNQGVRGEYLISTATGAASAPTGGGGTVDHASVYVAFKETAFTVGDPPHNSDQVAGAQIAILARKAVTAALITASAGLFQTPTPRGADPSFRVGVPIYVGGAPRARKTYYQSNFTVPYVAPVAVVVVPQGWQAPLSGAPNVAVAQPGFASVPYNTAQLSVNFTNFGWHGTTSKAPLVAKAVQGDSFVPFDTVQHDYSKRIAVPLDMGGAGPRLRQTYYQSQFDAPYVTPVVATPVSAATTIPLDMGGAAARTQTVYYQSRFETPYAPPVVVASASYGWWNGLSTPPSVVTARFEQWQLPYSVSTVVTIGGWQQPLSVTPAVAKAKQDFAFVPYNTAQLAVNYTDFDWYQPLSTPVLVAKAQQGSSFVPYNTAQLAVNYTSFGWYQPLSTVPLVAKARYDFGFVPYNTAQLAVNYTDFDWYQSLSTAVPVAKPQHGYSFVPFNTAQLAVNYTDFDWYQPLSVAPSVGKRLDTNQTFPFYQVIVNNTLAWQGPLSAAPQVAKAQQGFSFVPYNTAQLAVNYTDFDWYSPLSPAPPVAKAQQGSSFVPYNTVQLIVNYTNFGGYSPLSTAVPVAKAQQGYTFVPYNTAQVIVTYANFYPQPLSVAAPVARAAQVFGSVPYSTPQADTLEWQQPLSTSPAVAKVKTGDWQYPYSVASVVTADEWQQPLWNAPPVVKAQQGFSYVPFDTAQLAVNYTSYGWYGALSVPATITAKAAQEGFSNVPYNTPQRFAYSNLGWYQALSTVARVTPTGQQGFSFVPFDTQQRFFYTNFGWYCSLSVPAKVVIPQQGSTFVPFNTVQTATAGTEDHIVKFIGNVGHFMLR